MAGYVQDARTGEIVRKAQVIARWFDFELQRNSLHRVSREAIGRATDGDSYVVCGLPAGADVTLQIIASNFRKFDGDIVLEDDGVDRRDFRLAGANVAHGTGIVELLVASDSGVAIANGRVDVPSLGRTVTVVDGRASITDLPAGSWLSVVRSPGFKPEAAVLDAYVDSVNQRGISLQRLETVLDTVRVQAKSTSHNDKVLRAVNERLRVASGTLILSDNLAVRSATEASEAITVARGFSFKGLTNVTARPKTQGFNVKPCESAPSSTAMMTEKQIAIYLDGTRVPGGLQALNDMVRPSDILAIEAYPDVLSAPFLWRKNDTCAVIAFWTKR